MKYSFLILVCMLFFVGCFAQRNETVQKDALSYLLFSGSSQEASFSAYKENTPVYDNVKIQPKQRYSIAPGTYRLEVRHKGEIISNRLLFFSDGQTQEIRLP